jgi:carboxypeptidase C (cathepsin A)
MLSSALQVGAVALSLLSSVSAAPNYEYSKFDYKHHKRQNPANVTDQKTITAPSGVKLRYKEPGKAGVCETTPGVNSYSGYIDLNETMHTFFWFFEARHNPDTAPITLWCEYIPIVVN